MAAPSVLVVSAFESDLQPILAASAAASLTAAGATVTGWDAHVFPDAQPTSPSLRPFDLVLLSMPSFEALERGAELAAWFKRTGHPRVLVCGQYAWLNAAALAQTADGVLLEEPEGVAGELVAYAAGQVSVAGIPGVRTADNPLPPVRKRAQRAWATPARHLFHPIGDYPGHCTSYGLLGNLEATRGCHHRCTYCSVFAAYDVWAVPIDQAVILADARQLAAQGAEHFAFIDAEFFNTRRHAVRALEAVAADLGPCTFELTTRFDHILEFEAEIKRLVGLGLRKITSALEFPSDRILEVFDKGIDVAGIKLAIKAAQAAGVELRPTFITFTPWITYDELLGLDEFLAETGIEDQVDPTARQTRLLLFKGSPLLTSPHIQGVKLIDRGFYFDWEHPDPRVDQLWAQRRQQAVDVGQTRCCVRC